MEPFIALALLTVALATTFDFDQEQEINPFQPVPQPELQTAYDLEKRIFVLSEAYAVKPTTKTAYNPCKETTGHVEFQHDHSKVIVGSKDDQLLTRYSHIAQKCNIKKITVIGYTDSRGLKSYNWRLAQKRGNEVGRILAQRLADTGIKIEVKKAKVEELYKGRKTVIHLSS